MEERLVLGLTEEITIYGLKRSEKVTARIDTGATSSSLDLKLAEKLQLKELKDVKIVRSASGVGRRSVVHATVIIHGKTLEGDFTLANRSHMNFPLLIGQNILKKGRFLIDPLKKVQDE
ncbi:ATP-dependent zinc protease [Candidatus Woesearchaeota archaeon]|nr:ATP-dependent zinc protease [Candidatus Woesearchaeota archaeon]